MKRILALLMTLSLLSTTAFADNRVRENVNVDAQIANTGIELQKIKAMDGIEFELYLEEQAQILEG